MKRKAKYRQVLFEGAESACLVLCFTLLLNTALAIWKVLNKYSSNTCDDDNDYGTKLTLATNIKYQNLYYDLHVDYLVSFS